MVRQVLVATTSMESSLCRTFRTRSAWTWRQIKEYSDLSVQLSETTLTEQNLKGIKERHFGEVTTVHFNQVQEGYSGGDWEWWFHGITGLWAGFRIQAKIISPKTNRFEHLHYRNSRNEYQSDILIRSARAHGIIPLYCLYTFWGSKPLVTPFRCVSFRNSVRHFGCSLLRMEGVLKLRTANHSNGLNDVLPFLFPWHCLVCCSGFDGADLAERTVNFWRFAMGRDVGSENMDYGTVGVRQEAPRYVAMAVNGQLREAPDPFIKAITVIQEATVNQ
jgi:hypothetical protein